MGQIVKEIMKSTFGKHFFSEEEVDMRWCGAAAPPHIHSLFGENGVFYLNHLFHYNVK
jgi:hypothetical protein